jgi:hypothetical protein
VAISLVGITTGSHSSGTITLSTHANTQVGDLVLAFCQRDEGYGTAAWTGNPFTLLRDVTASGQGHGQLWLRVATAAGATSYSYTDTNAGNTAGTVHLVVVRGAQTPDASNTAGAANASSNSPTSPTVGSGTLAMLICGWGALRNYSTLTWGVASSGLTSGGTVQDPDGYWSGFVGYATGIAAGSKTVSLSTARTTRALSIYLVETSSSIDKTASDSRSGNDSAAVTAAVSPTDTGTGTDAAAASQNYTASDTADGADSAVVSIPVEATDNAVGDEVTSSTADVDAVEPAAAGVDVGHVDSDTQLDDSATGTDAAAIRIPVTDPGTASESHSETASITVTNPGTGLDGAFYDSEFGDLVISLWGVHPSTGAIVALPDVKSLTLSRERNSAGSIQFSYPVGGINFDLLRDTITDDRDLEFELWTIGSNFGALRGYLQEASGDDVSEDRTWTFAGGFSELRMGEAVTWPRPIITTTTVTDTVELDTDPKTYRVTKTTTVRSSAGGPAVTSSVVTTEDTGSEGTTTDSVATKGELEFAGATPGELMSTLMDEAQARGALTDLTVGFTDTHDSRGTAWPDTITVKFSPNVDYTSVLGKLVDFGLIEWGVTWTGTTRRLDMWIVQARGTDRTVGTRPIILRKARNVIDAPRKWSVRDSGTAVLASGSDGVYETANDANALSRRGRRIERAVSANNFDDPAALQGYAQNQLPLITNGVLEVTHGLGFLPGEPRPLVAFDLGDWLLSQTSAGLERLRVVQWTLSVDESRALSGTVTLNDTITDQLARLKARLDGLTQGDTVVGTSTGSGGQDMGVPLPPEIVAADSIAFLDGTLGTRAAVTVVWDPPVVNVDGTVITDLDHTTVEYELASSPDVWNAAATTPAPAFRAVFAAPAGQTIRIRARAVDRAGNTSVWSDPPYPITTSNDDVPPPPPSAAVVSEFLGTVRITWDGLTDTGAVMYEAAIDFDHIEIHLSPGSLFTPDESTLVGRLTGSGTWSVTDLPYNVTQFARFVAVDWSGNRSDPSGQGSATPVQIQNPDYADLSVTNGKIMNLSVGKLTAGTLSADVTLSSVIRTALSGNRVEISSGGIQLYKGSDVVVDLKTSNGSALVVGEFRTSLTGQRIVFNPGGVAADTMNFYPSAAGDFARIMSRTAPGDGTAAILIDGGAANGTARGRLGAYKSEAFISFVTNDAGGDTSAGFSRTAVSASTNVVLAWAQTEIQFDKYNGSTRQSGSRFVHKWTSGQAGSNVPTLVSENNSGIKLDSGAVAAVNSAGSGYVPMLASSFTVSSSRATKTDEAALAFDAQQVVRQLETRQWRYRGEVADNPAAPLHFGPMAEDVASVLPELVTRVCGVQSIDIRDLSGVLLAALRQVIARVDRIEGEL